jgi:hypothetical protein
LGHIATCSLRLFIEIYLRLFIEIYLVIFLRNSSAFSFEVNPIMFTVLKVDDLKKKFQLPPNLLLPSFHIGIKNSSIPFADGCF